MDKGAFQPKLVLRRNLKALMDKTKNYGPHTQGELHRKSGVAQSTIGRILSSEGEDSGIETVERIAKAYGLQGWQLMVAGMDPSNPPVLQPVSKAERALYDRLKELAKDMKESR